MLIPRELRGDGLAESVRFLTDSAAGAAPTTVRCASPIFVLSAGWRSGSTFLQRRISSNGAALIWGEPFGDRLPVCRLAATVQDFHEGDGHLNYSIDNFDGELSEEWIANMNPGLRALREAHLAFFETLFAEPAASRGYQRWGVKWVRLSADYAWYLKWLYPMSKVLFLVRHPLNAYRSYRGKKWFSVRPHHCVTGVTRFMAHWNYLASSFLKELSAVDGLLLRYEDVVADDSLFARISSYLDLPIEPSRARAKLGARSDRQRAPSLFERATCAVVARKTCRALGYAPLGLGTGAHPINSTKLESGKWREQ